MENYVMARENYKKATQLNANVAEAWFGIGITYDKEGLLKEALQYYKRAVLLEPENTEYMLVLAETEYRLNHFTESEKIYEQILEIDPGMMEAWLDWSFIKFSEGQLAEAADMLKEAIKTDPSCHQYHYRMVCYLYELGLVKEALVHLDEALHLCAADSFLIFEISPKLQRVPEIFVAIELHRK